jgi:hypothetical protein
MQAPAIIEQQNLAQHNLRMPKACFSKKGLVISATALKKRWPNSWVFLLASPCLSNISLPGSNKSFLFCPKEFCGRHAFGASTSWKWYFRRLFSFWRDPPISPVWNRDGKEASK